LPTTLGGTTLLINSTAVPLFSVSATQIVFQAPWQLVSQTSASIVVTSSGGTSSTFMASVAATAPGVFTSGSLQIQNVSGQAISSSNPAKPGDVIVTYCVGLGPVSNQPATGAASSGNPLSQTQDTVTATLGGIAAPVQFAGLAPGYVGLYQVNIQIPGNAPLGNSIALVVTSGGVSSISAPVAIATVPPVPSFAANGVVNGASFTAPLVAGGVASIFGTNLSTTGATSVGSALPWLTTLGGTTVKLNGTAAPLAYVSAGQVNFQVPWELSGQTTASVTVTTSSGTSNAQNVAIASFNPGIFTTNAGQGYILNPNTTVNSSTAPAFPGAQIEIFATGLGAVANQPSDGAAASGTTSTTNTIPTVTIDGISAIVVSSRLCSSATFGCSPTVGYYQITVTVPSGVTPGGTVPVVLSIGGATSTSVTMNIESATLAQPTIPTGGIVNGASFTAPLVAGGVASIFGTNLSTTNATGLGGALPWPTTMGGTTVTLNGTAAALAFVSAGQINFQVPWELAGQTTASVTVTTIVGTSSASTVAIASFSPAIFTTNGGGTGQGYILNPDLTINSGTSAAFPGAQIQIFATGLGAVANQPPDGAAASGTTSTTNTTPTVTIGGISATVASSRLCSSATFGCSPTLGYYQITVTVPSGVTAGGSVPVTLSIGGATSNTVTMNIAATAPPLAIAMGSNLGIFPLGIVQVPLQATGGVPPYTWSVTGALPNGLVLRTDEANLFNTISSTAIVGVATTPVSTANNFTLTVTDSQSHSISQAMTLSITSLAITDYSLPNGFVGVAYSYTLNSAGASGAVTWGVQPGQALPPGYSLNPSTGQITGTPTTGATTFCCFSITATDSSGTISRGFSINTYGVGFSTPQDLGNTTVGASFSAQIQGTGGTGPYTYSSTCCLPSNSGLSLSSSGLLSGTVGNIGGTSSIYITVTDSTSRSYNQQFILNVFGNYNLATINGPGYPADDATLGVPVSYSFSGYNGRSSYTWGLTGTLPTGMRFQTTGPLSANISGAPQQTGTFTVTVTLTDGTTPAITVSTPFTFNVKAVSADYPPNGTRGQPYSFYLRPIGGAPTFTWTMLSSALPNGLSFNAATGIISGTPTEDGSFSARFSIVQPNGNGVPTLFRTVYIYINSPTTPNIQYNGGTPFDGTVNQSYNYNFNFCCASGSLTYSVSSGTLPTGLTLNNSTGQLSGTATVAGQYMFAITATDSSNSANFGVRDFTINITPIAVFIPSLTGTTGVGFNATLTATGGTGTLTWALDSASQLPTGLTLNSNGTITGSTTFVGNFSFGYIVTDSGGHSYHGYANLQVGSSTVVITQNSNLGTFPMGVVAAQIGAIGGTITEVWSITAGALPSGLSLRSDIQNGEVINGVATTPGNYSFTVQVNNSGNVTSQAFTMRISSLVVQDQNYVPDGFAGVAYSGYTLSATGGTGTYTWTSTSGVPAGMTLSSAGVLTGTPTSAGYSNIFYTITDGVDTFSRSIAINVSKIQITNAGLLPTATQGAAYNLQLTSSGGTGTITWSGCCVPNGLTLSSTGLISGTVSTNSGIGPIYFSVTATDSTSTSYTKYMQIDVVGLTPGLVYLSGSQGSDCTVGVYCQDRIYAYSGGVVPFTWTVTGLPAGMSFRTGTAFQTYYEFLYPQTIELWGVPTVSGTFNVTVTVTDANNVTSTQIFPLKVSKLDVYGPPQGTTNVPYSYTFKVQGGTGPYTVQLTSGGFPAGLTFNTGTFTVSGTPVENSASTSFTLLFTDSSNPANTYTMSSGLYIAGNGTTTISLNNSILSVATLNVAYNYTLSACCVPTYAWSVLAGSSLPPGLSLNSSSGLLSGTPTVLGTYNFLVMVADATNAANFAIRNITLTVTNVTVTTNTLPYGNVGTAYSQTLAATGGTGIYTWSLVSGLFLPPGLSLNPNTGVISGTPGGGGFFEVEVVATDSAGNPSAARYFPFSIYAPGVVPPLVLNFGPTLGPNTVGTLTFSMSASGGVPPYTVSYTPGATPIPGMRFVQAPLLPANFGSGIPASFAGVIATPGAYTIPTRLTDSTGAFIDRTITWTVVNTFFTDQNNLLKATVNVPYSYTMHPTGGSGNYSITSTNLPAGLTVSTAGVISGTPTAVGSFSITLTLADTTNNTSIGFGYSIAVIAFSIDTLPVLPSGTLSSPYSQQLAAANCGSACTWTISSGSLPSGLTLSPGGLLSGTPLSFYNSGFALQASGSNGTVQKEFALLIAFPQPLQITTGASFSSSIGSLNSTTLFASGGQAPYTWSVTSGALPAGITIAGPGETLSPFLLPGFSYLAGRVTVPGTYAFTLKVTDSAATPNTATKAFTWIVFGLQVNYTNFPITTEGVTNPLKYNTPYSQQILVLGGSGNYPTWTILSGAFPPGLSMSSTGLITGTPTNTGAFNSLVQIQVTDDAGNTTTSFLTFNIASTAGNGVALSTGASSSYTFNWGNTAVQTLNPSGGTGPYTMTALTPLPSGCTLESGSSELSNVNTSTPYALVCTLFAPGTSVFTLQVTDSLGNIGVQNVTIKTLPFNNNTTSLANAAIGQAYSQFLPAFDALTPTLMLAPGSVLPAGLSLSGNNLVGTPTGPPGNYPFQVLFTDSSGASAIFGYSIVVSPIHIDVADIIPSQVIIGQPFTFTFTASGGGSNKTWTANNGVPSGMSLNSSTGVLSGTTFSGTNTYRITVTVSDGTYSYVHQFTLFAHLGVPALPSFALTATALGDQPVGNVVNIALSPSGGVAPFTYNVASGSTLPPGLNLVYGTSFASYSPGSNTVGLGYLRGAPTTAGAYTFDIIMTDSNGTQLRRTFTMNVTPVAIAIGGLKTVTTGVTYSEQLTGLGGTPPYTFTYAPTSQFTDMFPQPSSPGGTSCLTASSSGLISGTCNTTGSYGFLATVHDNAGHTYTTSYFYNVTTPAGLFISTPPDNTWEVGLNTNDGTLNTGGGSSTYTWTVSAGALPPGMSLVPSGTSTYLAGAPAVPGAYSYTLRATDNADTTGHTYAERNYNQNVGPMQPITYGSDVQSPLVARVGTAYSYQLQVAGGTPPYTFATTYMNPLPPGLTLGSSGVISGTPTQIGTFGFTYEVTDSTGKFTFSGIRPVSMTVLPATGVLPLNVFTGNGGNPEDQSHVGGSVGNPYAVALDQLVSGTGVAPYTWALASGSTLPPGLALMPGSNGVSSYAGGIPTAPGSYTFSLVGTDSAGQSGTALLTVNISPMSVTPTSAPNGVVGTPYSFNLLPSGGTAPYNFALATYSDLPPGLSFSSVGQLSGNPTYPGLFRIYVTLTDSAQSPNVVYRVYYVTIDAAVAGAQGISISPAQIQINYILTAPTPAPLSVSINATSGTIPFNAMVSGIPALSLSSTSGSAPASLNLNLNTAGLTAGTYSGVLAVNAPQADNAFAGIPVQLTVVMPPPCTYTLNPTAGSAPAAAGNGNFSVSTGSLCSWTPTTTDSFITITSGPGTGTGPVTYSLTANTGTVARTGNISVAGMTYPITQFGSSCAFAVNPSTITATAAGGQAFVQVKATSNSCAWAASGLSATPASGNGNLTVALTIPPNTTTSTTFLTATVAGQTVTINQSGINCTVSLSTSNATIGSGGGSGSVDVSTPAGCSYATVNGPSWLSVTSNGSGVGPGPVTLGFSATPNSTVTPRSGSLTIGDQSFLVSQDATACSVTVFQILGPNGLESPLAAGGGSGSVLVFANSPNCAWTATSAASWAAPSPTTGMGTGMVRVTASSNASSTKRNGSMTIAGQTAGFSQAGTICSYTLGSSVATVPNSGGNGTVAVSAANSCMWSSTPDPNATWLTITSSGSQGTDSVGFNAAPNTSSTPRTGTLTIQGQSFVVNEAATPCTYTLGSTSFNAPASGSNGSSFTYQTLATGCSTTATSFSSWIHVTSAQPVTTQSGSVSYSVDSNSAVVARTGTIQLAGQNFTVNQAAAVCNYSLSLYAVLWNSAGGNASILASQSANGCPVPPDSVDQPFVGVTTPTGPVLNIFTEAYTVSPFVTSDSQVRRATILLGGRAVAIKQTSW
jgi:uncharacterized protein (TIGR03437 family)